MGKYRNASHQRVKPHLVSCLLGSLLGSENTSPSPKRCFESMIFRLKPVWVGYVFSFPWRVYGWSRCRVTIGDFPPFTPAEDIPRLLKVQFTFYFSPNLSSSLKEPKRRHKLGRKFILAIYHKNQPNVVEYTRCGFKKVFIFTPSFGK